MTVLWRPMRVNAALVHPAPNDTSVSPQAGALIHAVPSQLALIGSPFVAAGRYFDTLTNDVPNRQEERKGGSGRSPILTSISSTEVQGSRMPRWRID
jgi:hypothetical protein